MMYYVSAAAACGYAWGVYQATQAKTFLDVAKSTAITAVATGVFARGLDIMNADFVAAGFLVVPGLIGYGVYKSKKSIEYGMLSFGALLLASGTAGKVAFDGFSKMIQT